MSPLEWSESTETNCRPDRSEAPAERSRGTPMVMGSPYQVFSRQSSAHVNSLLPHTSCCRMGTVLLHACRLLTAGGYFGFVGNRPARWKQVFRSLRLPRRAPSKEDWRRRISRHCFDWRVESAAAEAWMVAASVDGADAGGRRSGTGSDAACAGSISCFTSSSFTSSS